MNLNKSKHLILYADDDNDDLLFIKNAFLKYSGNIEIVTAYDGVEAIEFLKKYTAKDLNLCLIILDVNMPRLDGKEALKHIRTLEGFEEIPIVLFTTSSFQNDKDFAEKYKAGFISKPVNTKEIEEITDQFVKHCSEEVKKNLHEKIGSVL